MSESGRRKTQPPGTVAEGMAPRTDGAHTYRAETSIGAPRARGRGRPVLGADAFLDLAHKDCGDGPLEDVLRALRALAHGQTLEVRTTDDGVGVALVAWCRLAGHTLLAQRGGRFLIRQEAGRMMML